MKALTAIIFAACLTCNAAALFGSGYATRSLSLTTPCTLSAFIRFTGTNAAQVVISVGNTTNAYLAIQQVSGGGTNRVRLAVAGGGGADYTSSSFDLGVGTYSHVAATSDSSRSVLYLNGTPVVTNTASRSTVSFTTLSCGAFYYLGSNIQPLFGSLSDAAVYNVALSQSSISELNSGASPLLVKPQNLVSYVPLGIASPEPDYIGSQLTVTGSRSVTDSAKVYKP